MYLELLSRYSNGSKYFTWYANLIKRALIREELNGYSEKHHILPFSMGGPNEKANYVKLTSREHFLAHLMLFRFVKSGHQYKMARALVLMNQIDKSSRTYAKLRSVISEKMSGPNNPGYGKPGVNLGRKMSEETKAKMAAAKRGKKHSVETKAKISAALTDREFSDEHKENISKANTGRKQSDETKEKIGKASASRRGPNKGKKMSEEQKAKISLAVKATKDKTKLKMDEQDMQVQDSNLELLSV